MTANDFLGLRPRKGLRPYGGAHREELAAALTSAGVEAEGELVAAARRVLELVDPEGASAGKYQIVLWDNKRVHRLVTHNTQTNTFNA